VPERHRPQEAAEWLNRAASHLAPGQGQAAARLPGRALLPGPAGSRKGHQGSTDPPPGQVPLRSRLGPVADVAGRGRPENPRGHTRSGETDSLCGLYALSGHRPASPGAGLRGSAPHRWTGGPLGGKAIEGQEGVTRRWPGSAANVPWPKGRWCPMPPRRAGSKLSRSLLRSYLSGLL